MTLKIDSALLDILVCPLTRSRLHLEGDWLVGEVGGLRYPIRDGIPVLIVEEAQLPADCPSLDAFKERYKNQIPQ
ncbi:MAG: Trm112 family protein [Phycisphaerae bacterium]